MAIRVGDACFPLCIDERDHQEMVAVIPIAQAASRSLP
jgi:hypothetical protein